MIFQDFIWVHIIKVFGRLLESYRPAKYPQKEQVRYISTVKSYISYLESYNRYVILIFDIQNLIITFF